VTLPELQGEKNYLSEFPVLVQHCSLFLFRLKSMEKKKKGKKNKRMKPTALPS